MGECYNNKCSSCEAKCSAPARRGRCRRRGRGRPRPRRSGGGGDKGGGGGNEAEMTAAWGPSRVRGRSEWAAWRANCQFLPGAF